MWNSHVHSCVIHVSQSPNNMKLSHKKLKVIRKICETFMQDACKTSLKKNVFYYDDSRLYHYDLLYYDYDLLWLLFFLSGLMQSTIHCLLCGRCLSCLRSAPLWCWSVAAGQDETSPTSWVWVCTYPWTSGKGHLGHWLPGPFQKKRRNERKEFKSRNWWLVFLGALQTLLEDPSKGPLIHLALQSK